MRDIKKPISVCAVTGSRSDYGLLFWTLRRLHDDARFELRLLVTGMHLDPGRGLTWRAIIDDGFEITERIPILCRGDRDIDIACSLARGTDRILDGRRCGGEQEASEVLRPAARLISLGRLSESRFAT